MQARFSHHALYVFVSPLCVINEFNDPSVIRSCHKSILQWQIYMYIVRNICNFGTQFETRSFYLLDQRPHRVRLTSYQVFTSISVCLPHRKSNDTDEAWAEAVSHDLPCDPSKPRPWDVAGSWRTSNTSWRENRSELKERAPPLLMLYDSKLIPEPGGGKYSMRWRMDGWMKNGSQRD